MPVRCGHCCIANEGCQSRSEVEIPCPNCLPKWRCLTETFEPSQYSDACPTTHMAKMAYDCTSGGWVIVRHPVNPGMPVDVSVVLATRINASDKSECFYQVSLSHPDGDPITVDVELPDLLNPIEYDVDGGTYTIEIGGKVGVCFPLAEAQCSPCKVYTCIPERLRVEFEYTSTQGCLSGGQVVYVMAEWVDSYYYGEQAIGGDTVTVTVSPLETTCGFQVVIDGLPEGSVEPFEIVLEPPGSCDGHSVVVNELTVADGAAATTSRGRTGTPCSIATSLMYQTFDIVDYNGNTLGSGVIRDADCLAEAVDSTYRTCCLDMERPCLYSDVLHLGVIAPQCTGGLDGYETVLKNWSTSSPIDSCFTDGDSLIGVLWNNAGSPTSADRTIQCGPVGECLPIFIDFYLSCCFPTPECQIYSLEDSSKYRLWVMRALQDSSPVEANLVFHSCDPFMLEFEVDALWDIGGNCDCCTEGGTMTIRVTK